MEMDLSEGILYNRGMSETYLNGKITVTSLSAPAAKGIEILQALSEEDRNSLLNGALARGHSGPVSDKTVDDIRLSAFLKAKAKKVKSQYAVQAS